MKAKKLTFLFLFLTTTLSVNVSAQNSKDSLQTYVKLFNKVTSVDSLLLVYKFFESDQEKSLEDNNNPRVVYDLFYMADIEYRLGLYYDSENTAITALNLLDQMPDNETNHLTRKSFYNHLGRLKKIFKNNDSSLEYYLKALNLSKTKIDSAQILNNIGNLYRYKQEYVEAKHVLNKSYQLYSQIGVENDDYTMCLVNLGYVEGMLNNHETGIQFILKALQIRKQNNSPKIFEAYNSLTDYYKQKKEYSKAVVYARKALSAAEKFNSKPYKLLALRSLIDLEQADYFDSYIKLKDQIDLQNQINENKFALAKYNHSREKIEKEKERLKRIESDAKAQKSKVQSILYLLLIVLILIIFTFVFFTFQMRHKKEKLEQQFLVEQRISKQLHDEVANDVFFTLSRVQNNQLNKEQLLDDLETMYNKTRDISKVNSNIDVSKEYEIILEDLILSYQSNEVNIIVSPLNKIDWNSFSDQRKKVLYRVIQELLTNMRKHSKATLVTFQFEKNKNRLIMNYADNGVGASLKKGNGLLNVETRIKMIRGQIKFDTNRNKGFRTQIVL